MHCPRMSKARPESTSSEENEMSDFSKYKPDGTENYTPVLNKSSSSSFLNSVDSVEMNGESEVIDEIKQLQSDMLTKLESLDRHFFSPPSNLSGACGSKQALSEESKKVEQGSKMIKNAAQTDQSRTELYVKRGSYDISGDIALDLCKKKQKTGTAVNKPVTASGASSPVMMQPGASDDDTMPNQSALVDQNNNNNCDQSIDNIEGSEHWIELSESQNNEKAAENDIGETEGGRRRKPNVVCMSACCNDEVTEQELRKIRSVDRKQLNRRRKLRKKRQQRTITPILSAPPRTSPTASCTLEQVAAYRQMPSTGQGMSASVGQCNMTETAGQPEGIGQITMFNQGAEQEYSYSLGTSALCGLLAVEQQGTYANTERLESLEAGNRVGGNQTGGLRVPKVLWEGRDRPSAVHKVAVQIQGNSMSSPVYQPQSSPAAGSSKEVCCTCSVGCSDGMCECCVAGATCTEGLCACAGCKNPLNILHQMGLPADQARTDPCLMENIYQVCNVCYFAGVCRTFKCPNCHKGQKVEFSSSDLEFTSETETDTEG
ncbi:hypothetical protein MAR_000078 [Mya arenaria]|uniref:Tesmin/TSO1-like CXC domain-containing protein n=1 Tax=Mya arenaria TaxID=6604 RepID=A0ABY7F7Z3_MYAAR|nr:hypothetical protein MAR_000078 [Mya arenaria]